MSPDFRRVPPDFLRRFFLFEEEIEAVVARQPSCDQAHQVVTAQPGVRPHNLECGQATPSASTQQSSAETQSETVFHLPKTIKTIKTYIDFKDSLSPRERENFFEFVEKKIKNLDKPINDLEAWLASETKAGQHRWQVYYQIFRQEQKQYLTSSSQPTEVTVSPEKELAIKNWQAFLQEQKSKAQPTRKDFEPNLELGQQSQTRTIVSRETANSLEEAAPDGEGEVS